jgi:hypothetical protein
MKPAPPVTMNRLVIRHILRGATAEQRKDRVQHSVRNEPRIDRRRRAALK